MISVSIKSRFSVESVTRSPSLKDEDLRDGRADGVRSRRGH